MAKNIIWFMFSNEKTNGFTIHYYTLLNNKDTKESTKLCSQPIKNKVHICQIDARKYVQRKIFVWLLYH